MDEWWNSERLSMKIGLFVDKGTELMRLSMKWGIFMDEWGNLERLSMKWGGFMEREQGAKKGGGWRLAGKMLRRGKGRGCGFEGERFLKMWNRMYIYIRPSQDKSRQETSLLPSRTRQMKEEEKKQQKKP